LKYYSVWDHKQYSSIVADPFTAPGALKSTSRAGTDERRMNSIDNGLLLCLVHHKEFDTHMFSIHPETHIVTSFHPRTRSINNWKIEQPWASPCDSNRFPPPHPTLLREHFQASIARWMKAASEEYEEEDSFDDEDEIAEMSCISRPEDRYVVIGDSGEDTACLRNEKGHVSVESLNLQQGMLA